MERVLEPTIEQPLYHRGDDLITPSQVQIQGHTLPLSEIESVSLVDPVMRPQYGYIAIGVGLLLAIVGYLVWQPFFLTPMLGGLALIIVGVVIITVSRSAYTVRINSNSGNTTIAPFRNRRDAADIVAALSQAIARNR